MTADQLAHILDCHTHRAALWTDPLNVAMARFEISTPLRQAAFVAQCAHESGHFLNLEENLHYSAAVLLRVFPQHFTAMEASRYANQPERIANRVYADRMGNGNEASQDGWQYRGRGLIQLTGHDNYRDCGRAVGLDLVDDPGQLLAAGPAALSAAWYWAGRGLNALADAGDFATITRKINGGLNGQDDRLALYRIAKEVLA